MKRQAKHSDKPAEVNSTNMVTINYIDEWGQKYAGVEWDEFKVLYKSLPIEAKEKADHIGSHPLEFVKHHQATLKKIVRKTAHQQENTRRLRNWKTRFLPDDDQSPS